MREILFRGKSLYNGKWYEGADVMHKTVRGELCLANVGEDWTSVDPETVGQFTGLVDKNGARVYEGDILRCESESWGDSYITDVWTDGNTLCVDVKHQDYDYAAINLAAWLWDNEYYEIEVIGNVFDNPELLKEGRK